MTVKTNILVVASESVGGRNLVEAVQRRMQRGPVKCTVICPQNPPRRGYVIEDESVASAQNRVELVLHYFSELGIEAVGQVADPDPLLAVKDALRQYEIDEIVIATYPPRRSRVLKKAPIDRIRQLGLPVEHVIFDVEEEDVQRALVVANKTVGGSDLVRLIEDRSLEGPHEFMIVCPQSGAALRERRSAHRRLRRTLELLKGAGVRVVGQVVSTDPLAAVRNALQYYPADKIIVSTYPEVRSGWLRGNLIVKIKDATGLPVEHIVAEYD